MIVEGSAWSLQAVLIFFLWTTHPFWFSSLHVCRNIYNIKYESDGSNKVEVENEVSFSSYVPVLPRICHATLAWLRRQVVVGEQFRWILVRWTQTRSRGECWNREPRVADIFDSESYFKHIKVTCVADLVICYAMKINTTSSPMFWNDVILLTTSQHHFINSLLIRPSPPTPLRSGRPAFANLREIVASSWL